jgi:hypothetical protein
MALEDFKPMPGKLGWFSLSRQYQPLHRGHQLGQSLEGCQHAQQDLLPEIGTLTPTVCPVNQALIANLPPNLDTDQMKAAHGRNVDAATGNFDQECRAL